jgi:hypothetical protein
MGSLTLSLPYILLLQCRLLLTGPYAQLKGPDVISLRVYLQLNLLLKGGVGTGGSRMRSAPTNWLMFLLKSAVLPASNYNCGGSSCELHPFRITWSSSPDGYAIQEGQRV